VILLKYSLFLLSKERSPLLLGKGLTALLSVTGGEITEGFAKTAVQGRDKEETRYLQSLLFTASALKKSQLENPDQSPERAQAVQVGLAALPLKLKDAEGELDRLLGLINTFLDDGDSAFESADRVLGYSITNDELSGLAKNLRHLVLDTDISPPDVARLINEGNPKLAITKVENALLRDVDRGLNNSQLAASTVEKVQKAISLASEVDPSFIGAFDTGLNKYKLKTPFGAKSAERRKAAKLNSLLNDIAKDIRLKYAGSAVTDTELEALSSFLVDIGDQPEITVEKLRQIEDSTLVSYNAARRQVGLPELNTEQLLNPDLRQALYDPSLGAVMEDAEIVAQRKAKEVLPFLGVQEDEGIEELALNQG